MKNNIKPVHPGQVLLDELDELEISQTSLAKLLGAQSSED